MIRFWAVMMDETGCEFGVGVEARSKGEAYMILAEDYVESKCVQLESDEEMAERERLMYERICRDMDGDWEEEEDY